MDPHPQQPAFSLIPDPVNLTAEISHTIGSGKRERSWNRAAQRSQGKLKPIAAWLNSTKMRAKSAHQCCNLGPRER